MNNSELEVSQTYRSRFVAELPEVYSHPNWSIHFVYTEWVDDGQIVWDSANRKHLGSDHPDRTFRLRKLKRRFTTSVASRPSFPIGKRIR